jgi:hypothetical protein
MLGGIECCPRTSAERASPAAPRKCPLSVATRTRAHAPAQFHAQVNESGTLELVHCAPARRNTSRTEVISLSRVAAFCCSH